MKRLLTLLLLAFTIIQFSEAQINFAQLVRTDTFRLVFIGDLMQHQTQINGARNGDGTYSYDSCFSFIRKDIQAADYAIGNFETTLAGTPHTGYPKFSAPDEFLQALQNTGFHLMVTANNHIFDKGLKGYKRTLDKFEEFGIPYIGTYRNQEERDKQHPFIVEKNGLKIAFIAYTYGTNGMTVVPPSVVNLIDTVQIAKDVATAKQHNPDIIIAIMHWGEEYHLNESAEQKKVADFIFSQGVPVIIGSHPHVIQPMYSTVDSAKNIISTVAYSLGNAVSNQNDEHTDIGALAHITLTKNFFGGTKILDSKYSLIWRYRPKNNKGGKSFYIIPANDFYDGADFFSAEDYKAFKKAVDNTRKRLSSKNKNFDERL